LATGLTAVICASLLTVTPVAGFAPNRTDVAPVNPEPLRVTTVPAAPLTGLKPITTGGERLKTGEVEVPIPVSSFVFLSEDD
jgi:hypothetical protein